MTLEGKSATLLCMEERIDALACACRPLAVTSTVYERVSMGLQPAGVHR